MQLQWPSDAGGTEFLYGKGICPTLSRSLSCITTWCPPQPSPSVSTSCWITWRQFERSNRRRKKRSNHRLQTTLRLWKRTSRRSPQHRTKRPLWTARTPKESPNVFVMVISGSCCVENWKYAPRLFAMRVDYRGAEREDRGLLWRAAVHHLQVPQHRLSVGATRQGTEGQKRQSRRLYRQVARHPDAHAGSEVRPLGLLLHEQRVSLLLHQKQQIGSDSETYPFGRW